MRRRLAPALVTALALATLPAGAAYAAEAPPGAWSCTGCHAGAKEAATVVPPLVGRPAAETVGIMREFKSGARPATVMSRIARGFNDAEIDAIAKWFGEQRP